MPTGVSPAFTSFHAILAFLVPVLLNFLEVKFEGKPESPFESHPFATSLAIFSLLFYSGLALVTHLSLASACCARPVHITMALAAMLSVASLASLLVPGPFQSLPYFLSFVLLPVVLLLCLARNLYTWEDFRPRRLAAPLLLPGTVLAALLLLPRTAMDAPRLAAPPLLPRTVMDARRRLAAPPLLPRTVMDALRRLAAPPLLPRTVMDARRRLAALPLLPRTVMDARASCRNWESVQVDPSPDVLRVPTPSTTLESETTE